MAHAEPPSPDQGTVSALCPFDHEEEQGEADERQRPQLEGGKSCRGQKSKQKGGDVGMTCQHERCYRLLWDEFQPRMARPPINGPPLYQSHRAHAAVPILADDDMIVDAYAQPSARFDRSEERRVGNEGVSKCRYGWSP